MRLSDQQVTEFRDRGFLLLPSVFSDGEVEDMRRGFDADRETPGEHRVLEDDGTTVRAVYASHVRQPALDSMVRSGRVLEPVHQLLDDQVYVYQFKINAKTPFAGAGWAWHQDFAAWRAADGLRRPDLLNVAVFLDDITEFNGPVIFLPGSHRRGLVGPRDHDATGGHLDPDDIAITPAIMRDMVAEHGMESVKGPAGSVAIFGPEIVHGSAPNVSPSPRALAIVTYNDVTNVPPPSEHPRPEYLVGRDTRPVEIADLEPAHG